MRYLAAFLTVLVLALPSMACDYAAQVVVPYAAPVVVPQVVVPVPLVYSYAAPVVSYGYAAPVTYGVQSYAASSYSLSSSVVVPRRFGFRSRVIIR